MPFARPQKPWHRRSVSRVDRRSVAVRLCLPRPARAPQRHFNNFHTASTTSTEAQRLTRNTSEALGSFGDRGVLSQPWNPVFSARRAANGTRLRWTNPRGGGRTTWRIARCAASQMCCAWSTISRRRNFSLPQSWSEKSGPQTSDLRPQTSDRRLQTSDLRPRRAEV